jgi:magnesium transporter
MGKNMKEKYGINSSLIERIQNAIDMGLKTQIKKLVPDLHYADQADLIYNLSSEQREEFIKILEGNLKPEVLIELEGAVRSEIIKYLNKNKLAEMLSSIDTDDAVEIIEDLKSDLTQETLDAIKSNKKREEIEEALSYPEDSVGRLMMPKRYVAVPKDWNVGDVIKYMRRNQKLPKEFSDIVVVDEYYRPVSIASVGSIIQSEKTKTIAQLMSDPEEMKILRAEMDQSEAALLFKKYDLKLAPVVNDNGVLSGVISLVDIVDVIDEEAEEDMLLMGNVKNDDVHLGFLKASRSRFPWLVTTVLSTAIGSSVIDAFSSTVEKNVALAVLMPVISGLGGVAGTQTLTVLVRNLATQEVNKRNAIKIIFKEVLMGLFNGLLIASLGATAVYFWNGSLNLSMIFGATIMFILILSGFIGSTVPLIVTKLKLDPAVTSGSFITTTIDILSFLLFLKLATMLLV